MRQYRIDYRKLAVMLLPTFLRRPTLVSLVRVMVQPLQTLHDRWNEDCEKRDYNLQHTGQVCSIKALLNKQFGLNYINGFEIEDINANGNWVMAYDEATNLNDNHTMAEDSSFFFVHDEETITEVTSSFIIYVPAKHYNEKDLPVIRTIVGRYRLVSRIPMYKIKP